MEIKNSNHKHLPVWLWVTFLVVVIIGGFYIFWRINQPVYYEPIGPEPSDLILNEKAQIPTADWKTYANKDLGFSFKYPADWEIREDNTDKKIIILDPAHKVIQQAGGELGLSIVFGNNTYSSFDDMVDKTEKNENTEVIDKALNDKISAKFIKTIEGRSEYLIQSPDKKYFFSIYDNPSNSVNILDFNQILSTFQFTDSVVTTSQVYTNSTYGFSLNFPKGWEGYKIKESDLEGLTKVYYINIPTKDGSIMADSTTEKGYFSPFAVSVYTLDEWAIAQKEEGFQDNSVAKNDKYVFTASQSNGIMPDDFDGQKDVKTIIESLKLD